MLRRLDNRPNTEQQSKWLTSGDLEDYGWKKTCSDDIVVAKDLIINKGFGGWKKVMTEKIWTEAKRKSDDGDGFGKTALIKWYVMD
jgi:hypothetical protein